MAVVRRVAALPARVSASFSRSAALGDCGAAGGDSTVTRRPAPRPGVPPPAPAPAPPPPPRAELRELRGADRDDGAATATDVVVSSSSSSSSSSGGAGARDRRREVRLLGVAALGVPALEPYKWVVVVVVGGDGW